ncbi:hypothetical protein JTB14_023760 [Gonioctena quinquepunctata]|nr:hypothetical protein JTB14_023760 [Gonioctena quinquepunctata]
MVECKYKDKKVHEYIKNTARYNNKHNQTGNDNVFRSVYISETFSTMNMHSSNPDNNIDDISREDISKAVGKKLNTEHFVILRYKSQPLPEKVGLLGDHSTTDVTILNAEGSEETISFFLKYYPKDEAPAVFADGLGAFKKEIFVYGLLEEYVAQGVELASSIAPSCYLAEYNKLLVLDNLVDGGFETLDKHNTLDYDTILVVLQSLAKFHASSLIYEIKLGHNLLEEYGDDLEESFFNDREGFINEKGIEASIKCIEKEIEIFDFPSELLSGKNFPEVARIVCSKIYDLVKPSNEYRNVLTHGDLWVTNFLIKYTSRGRIPTECRFVDFQYGRYTPPSQDVLSLIYLTTNREFREKYMYQVIGMYYNYLERHLKAADLDLNKIIPFPEFMESCEKQKLFAIVQTAIYFPLILIRNNAIHEYFSDKSLNEKALFEDRSYLVLAHKDKDEMYEQRLIESIQDLKDFCEHF